MKISTPVRALYEVIAPKAELLKNYCAGRLNQRNNRWHYEARVKSLESFALKLETGRVKEASAMEDIFACTLVVPSYRDVAEAVELIEEHFDIKEKRPRKDDKTHKRPAVFDFDDLRLYVTPKESPAWFVDSQIVGMKFEVQIKTFLQHAWAIATHDLVYKADSVSWPLERVSFQVKAMLEHAELVIAEAPKISDSSFLKKVDSATERTSKVIGVVARHWEPGQLPKDVRRVAANFCALLESLQIEVDELEKILDKGKQGREGHSLDSSPYETLLIYLLRQRGELVRNYVSGKPDKRQVYVMMARPIEGFEDFFDNANAYPGLVVVSLPEA
ncbi:hypothetical protein [Xanthomonas sp. fls2-241-TYG-148]|uniref:hypothetical protein n=1 Tax=Xanthomonas sp. fls2-241-TYG-148 TaxID=3040328 RepID=UPI0025548E75|nr:hypothetical protein [Xanthomonas sp. fls2-241-TYG-148]